MFFRVSCFHQTVDELFSMDSDSIYISSTFSIFMVFSCFQSTNCLNFTTLDVVGLETCFSGVKLGQ